MNFDSNILNVFLGCCASSFLMEILMARAPQTSMLITFLQFVFIALQGLVFTSKFGQVKPKVPIKEYAILVALYFVTSVPNNYVYSLHVPSTLHMIIRSASSPASMLVSWAVKKQLPKFNKCIGSILISLGVMIAMYGGATLAEQKEGEFFQWCIGVAILLSTLFLGAFTGLQQEILFTKYQMKSEEMLFYTHFLPLPLFLSIFPQIRDTATSLTIHIWLITTISIISQFYCIRAVNKLATMETSVTITFILTLRKFVSLLISSIVFKNNLTFLHVLGTIFVAIGTYVYLDFFERRKQKAVSMKKE